MGKRKFVCIMLVAVLVICNSAISFAESKKNADSSVSDIVIHSEAEMILLKENGNTEQLVKQGYSQNEINQIMDIDFHTLLLERAALPDKTLDSYGYTDEQIRALRAYDGGTITADSPVLVATATVSAKPYIYGYSRTNIGIRWEWSWNVRPLVCLKDSMAIKWKTVLKDGTVSEGQATEAFALVRYYDAHSGAEDHVKKITATNTSTYKQATDFSFQMVEVVTNETWAKKGTFYLKIKPTTTNAQLDHITCYPSYGHKVLSCTVSVLIVEDVLFPIFTPKTKVTTTNFNEVLGYYSGKLAET